MLIELVDHNIIFDVTKLITIKKYPGEPAVKRVAAWINFLTCSNDEERKPFLMLVFSNDIHNRYIHFDNDEQLDEIYDSIKDKWNANNATPMTSI